jgi:ribosomal protein L16 Arg81 hydroxylase
MTDAAGLIRALILRLPVSVVLDCLTRLEPRHVAASGLKLPVPTPPRDLMVDLTSRPSVVHRLNTAEMKDRNSAHPPQGADPDKDFVCVRSFEWRFPELRQALADLRRAVGWHGSVDVRVYASRPNGGLSAHHDPRHAFVTQLSGEKVWRFAEVCESEVGSYEGAGLSYCVDVKQGSANMAMPNGVLWREVRLQRGDILFMPSGCIHATTSEQVSLACNISFNP